MNPIINFFNKSGLDFQSLLWTLGITLVSSILLSAVGRFVFGKRSSLSIATSSAIGILFVYALNIVLLSSGLAIGDLLTDLPFISQKGSRMLLFSFSDADLTAVCTQLTGLILLAFLMNLIDRFLPKGKHFITWLVFRCLAVVLAQIAYIAATALFNTLLPEGFLTYAPAIILAILLLMLLTGALKFILGIFLTTVNPLIAAFYTFFFANLVGKQVTRAVLTTAILTGLFYLLDSIGITAVTLAIGALVAYIPLLILLWVLWYLLNKLF